MKRAAALIAAAACLAAPAFADPCNAATEAATRAALDAATAAGKRTTTVRVACDGTYRTFILSQRQDKSGTMVSVREIKAAGDGTGLSGAGLGASGSAMTKIIRIGE